MGSGEIEKLTPLQRRRRHSIMEGESALESVSESEL